MRRPTWPRSAHHDRFLGPNDRRRAAFIESFRGTPTQVQIVSFSYYSQAIGAGSDWHHYIDMTDDAAVDALKSAAVDVAEPDRLVHRR